jgi:PIN domain nuclease of toxin-antitoxin system
MNGLAADTHAAIWYQSKDPKLSKTALAAMEATLQAGDPIIIASITLVEIAYLVERGRLPAPTFDLLEQDLRDPLGCFELAPLDLDVSRALRHIPRNLVPDMPDRIITATAYQRGLTLITADSKIRMSGVVATIW